MTIDQMLVYIPQLTARNSKLDNMKNHLPKERVQSGINRAAGIVEYKYSNYDIKLAEADYILAADELARAQNALERINSTIEFEVDECNFPLMQTMDIMALFSWELSRAVAQASREIARVKVVEEPMPPILNNAQIEWVSLYVGKKPFEGKADMQTDSITQNGENVTLDIHLCEVRELQSDPLIAKLIDAYDADYAARKGRKSTCRYLRVK